MGMRAEVLALTTEPVKYFENDPCREAVLLRNDDLAIDVYLQFRSVSSKAVNWPIKHGEILVLDRGDLTDEIYLWASAAVSVNLLIG